MCVCIYSTLAQCTLWILTVCASESAPMHLLVQRKSGGESPLHKGIKGESDTFSISTSRFLQRSFKGMSNTLRLYSLITTP